jgi:sugar phosphate isomerase/epimerase
MNIYGSVVSESELELLRSNGLGIELNDYGNPSNLDSFDAIRHSITPYLEGMLGTSMHGAYYDMAFASSDPLIVEVTKKRFLQSIHAASFHGINRIVFHSSYRTFYAVKPSWYKKMSIQFWKSFEQNIPDDMIVLLENVEDDDPEVFAEIIHGIDSPKIRCCFDLAHAHVYSSAPLDKWIRVLGDKIIHAHVSDNDGKLDQHLPLGAGNLPLLSALNDLMLHAGDDIPVVMECEMTESLNWFRKHNLL